MHGEDRRQRARRVEGAHGIGQTGQTAQLFDQRGQRGVAARERRCAREPRDQRARHLFEVHDRAAQAVGRERESHQVGRVLAPDRRRARERSEHRDPGAVRTQHAPGAVDEIGGERLVPLEQEREHALDRRELGRAERRLPEHRREARRAEQRIALAQRHVERFREAQHHLATRLRSPGLDEREMARRDAGLGGEPQLAHTAPRAPLAQEPPERARRAWARSRHAADLRARASHSRVPNPLPRRELVRGSARRTTIAAPNGEPTMNFRTFLILDVLLVFLGLTVYAIETVGYIGFFRARPLLAGDDPAIGRPRPLALAGALLDMERQQDERRPVRAVRIDRGGVRRRRAARIPAPSRAAPAARRAPPTDRRVARLRWSDAQRSRRGGSRRRRSGRSCGGRSDRIPCRGVPGP